LLLLEVKLHGDDRRIAERKVGDELMDGG
jgi:hypothetical protein